MWFQKILSTVGLLLLFIEANAGFFNSEVFHLLEENYQNYCKGSSFTTESFECEKSKKDHLLYIEKVAIINEALTLKKKKLSAALKKNIFAKKCLGLGKKSDHCDDIETIVIKYIDSLNTLSKIQNVYATECISDLGVGKFEIDEECAKEVRPSIKIFSQIVRDFELKNPFLTKLKKKIINNQSLYNLGYGREYENLIENQQVIDDVFDSIIEIEGELLLEFQKTKEGLESNMAEALVNDSIGLSTDQRILLAELSSLYFNEVSNPNLNPHLQYAKCQLQNKVLYEENWNNVGDFGIDIMLTIGSYGLGSTFFTKSASIVAKNKKIVSGATLVLGAGMPLGFEISRAKKVMSKCENLEKQLLVELDQSERVFTELKQCEIEAMTYLLSLAGDTLAFSTPLLRKSVNIMPEATLNKAFKSPKPLEDKIAIEVKVSQATRPASLIPDAKPYEIKQSGDLIKSVDVKSYEFLDDGPHVFLKSKDGDYFIAPVLGGDIEFPANIEMKEVISFLRSNDKPFLNTHRSMIRKFNLHLDDIVSSGELYVSEGKILNINNKSGTLRHDSQVLDQVAHDFGVPLIRTNPVETSSQLKKHSTEEITAGLRKYFENNTSYERVQVLKKKTAELLDKKNINYSDLKKQLSLETRTILQRLKNKEPGVSKDDLKNASEVQKTFNHFIYNEEPEIYLLNSLLNQGEEKTQKVFKIYEEYLSSVL